MKQPNQGKPTKLLAAVLVLLTLQCISLQAAGQIVPQPRRGYPHYVQPGNAGYNVWVALDVLRGLPAENGAANFSSGSSLGLYRELAGVWTTTEIPGLVLTLQADSNFALATSAKPEQLCSTGTERGNWAVTEETSELRFHIKTDTNGACGLSDLHSLMTIRLVDTSLMVAINEPAGDIRELPLVRR